ncbi:hypothetical protein SERLADRAFT_404908 [Serpula lacrymans var. lacrymans S7.9]|uniref:Glycosyltransferase family 32 protein n=1 Tax=Serpula lacrymans var. lacrymans (strain S7.9) TaxID=578457 RepID=F8NFY2_SERL9|nr:uncharacterized protein SERLADRAFT_404908 [Serpula lacrymans var. lacrymans S7.9]EGO30952.1 hypothetical protein SERLADRAFT_404908 [Serpula lacrymans var. lacrymans S7.9]
MASSSYLAAFQRGASMYRDDDHGNLPSYSSAVKEKLHRRQPTAQWSLPFAIPVSSPDMRRPRLRILSSTRTHHFKITRLGRKRKSLCRCLALLASIFALYIVVLRLGMEDRHWTPTFRDPSTLVFGRENLQKIWKWEIESGHYPSSRKIPQQIGLTSPIPNPAIPPAKAHTLISPFTPPLDPVVTSTRGYGPRRVYVDIESHPSHAAYPPRPVPSSTIDLDIILDHCDFTQKKYVRDCLEVLRVGGNLDNGRRLRRGEMDEWKYIFVDGETQNVTETPHTASPIIVPRPLPTGHHDSNAGLTKKRGVQWEPRMVLPPTSLPQTSMSPTTSCDPDNPRLFHMFWTGPFTDKPYMALLSFLFTQNLGLDLKGQGESPVCRPQFWLWINPGPAAAVPNASAMSDMFTQLKTNPWAAPFLHPRFRDVIKFRLWNTTEQLDGIPELKDEWRSSESLFNSGGVSMNVPIDKQHARSPGREAGSNGTVSTSKSDEDTKSNDDTMVNRTGSKSSSSYDKLSVILSDMARFILCHRYGGIYLDADTIFLRDWEELWGWKGAFAYRWSYHDDYNTAVLHLNKYSALGSFLFRTALKNGLDFHPVVVSKYLKDAHLDNLLFRIPDALFDSAWLNMEGYQHDRPPQPSFSVFEDFFVTPDESSAAPHALGFEGFFRGAYSYHFHNFWWDPFDSARNWPDLGSRFGAGERAARAVALPDLDPDEWVDAVSKDKRDLDWATVLKRTFEAYVRGERPNMYGEFLQW